MTIGSGPDLDWYEVGDYDGTVCSHCGRERVMVCDAPDETHRRVCEKCGWDQVADDYAAAIDFAVARGLQAT